MTSPSPTAESIDRATVTTPGHGLRLPGRSPGSSIRWLYLALAICGAILPWMSNLAFIQTYGSAFDLGLFLRLASANPAAQSLSRDLAVASTAMIVWMVIESRRLGIRGLPWVLLSCVTIAFACGAPLFLYLRERRLDELASQDKG